MEKSKLPNGWELQRLDSLANIAAGYGFPKKYQGHTNLPIPFIKVSDMNLAENELFIRRAVNSVDKDILGQIKGHTYPRGTIIFPKIGGAIATNKKRILSIESTFDNNVMGLVPNTNAVDPMWLFYFLMTIDLMQLANIGPIPSIRQTAVQSLPVPVPHPNNATVSLETQRRIVLRLETLLEEVKSAGELQEKIEEETNLLVDAVLNEIFSGRDEWQNEKPLDELVSIEASLVDPREPEYSGLPHIYGASIESGTGRLLEYQSAAEDGMTSSKYLFEPGVVLYSKIRPYLRKVTIADFKGVCSADMYPLTVTSDEILPEFLMWSLLSPEFTEFINAFSLRARIPKVNREQLMAYRVRYPDINSQKKIAAYIQNWREEVSEMQRAQNENAELLQQTEQSLLAQAFRGEL